MGGISRYALALIDGLAELPAAGAHRWTIFHSRKDRRDHTPAPASFRRGVLWTPCHHRLERWALGFELRSRKLDLFHSPDFIPPAWGVGRRIITVHDLNFWYYPHFLTPESRRYYGQIEWAAGVADGIACDSEHTRQDLLSRLNLAPEKVRTIYLAANEIYRQPVAPGEVDAILARYGLPHGFILFVGTLEPRKNVPTLLQAYHRLRRDIGFDLPLVLVGRKGWMYGDIFVAIRELDLGSSVYHVANADNRDLRALYHAALALALPSHYEGFGLPPLEAMHCGCPVIVSDRASLREVVGDAGPRLEPEDVDGWAAALARMAQDSDYRVSCIERGRQQAAQFSWTRTARETMALYESSL